MDKKDLTYDFIHNSDVHVYQRKDMFRINSDTSLLAHFMEIQEGNKVLDVGTNNGALLLFAAQYKPSYLCGIDIQEEACELARFNMEEHGIKNAEIKCVDFSFFNESGYDVVVSNPPYFALGKHRIEEENYRSIARHEMYLPLETLLKNVSATLVSQGRFYMVHRASRIDEITTLGEKYQLQVKTKQFVYDKRKADAISVLVEMIKDGNCICEEKEDIVLG